MIKGEFAVIDTIAFLFLAHVVDADAFGRRVVLFADTDEECVDTYQERMVSIMGASGLKGVGKLTLFFAVD